VSSSGRYAIASRTSAFASMTLSAGEHPMRVAKQMGHKDWTMIARVYGKWMPDADPSAGTRAVASLRNPMWHRCGKTQGIKGTWVPHSGY
jgi:hypothetical protein